MKFKISIATLSLITLASVAAAVGHISSQWRAQRDDLAEYLVDRTVSAASRIVCASLASEKHQVVSFSRDEGVCRLLSCSLGWSGCRKCRNAANSSLPLLMVRRLDSLGPSCCWRTFQHRVDASVDFYRNWTDYLSPFGQSEDRNFWMGLEAIHQLTRAGDRRVRWEMSSWIGSWWWWENSVFSVEDADHGYRVTLGDQDLDRSNVLQCPKDSWGFMNGQNFSTYDNEQDQLLAPKINCANKFHGAWWYKVCHCFNPNGRYFSPPTALSLTGSNYAAGITFSRSYPDTEPSPLDYTYSMRTFECLVIDFV